MKITVLNDTSVENHHGCSIVMSVIHNILSKLYGADIIFVPLGVFWSRSESIKREIISSDAVIVNGEGTIHHNSMYGFELLSVARFARSFNVPSFLINCSYQGNSESLSDLARFFEGIYVRESRSHNELLNHGIHSCIVPDLTFYNFPKLDFDEQPRTNAVYVTDSVLPFVTGSLRSIAMRSSFIELSIFNGNMEKVGFWDRLFSLLKSGPAHIFDKLFGLMTGFMKSRMENLPRIEVLADFQSWVLKIRDAKAVYCGRFHATTICIKSKTPFIAIESNTHKVLGVLEDIGLDLNRRYVAAQNLSPDSAPPLDPFTFKELSSIESYVIGASEKIDKMFSDIVCTASIKSHASKV